MYARVWKAIILPGKVEEFEAAVKSIILAWRQMAGFRGLLVLRTGPGETPEVTVVSTWETLEDLRGSQNDTFQQAVVRVLSYCEPHPSVREEHVVVSEFASPRSSDITAID